MNFVQTENLDIYFLHNLYLNKIENNFSTFNYLGEEMLLNQFSILTENVQKTLPPGHEGTKLIADQVKRLKSKREKWPEKIIQTWLERKTPVFFLLRPSQN